jgi:hypothetical protein
MGVKLCPGMEKEPRLNVFQNRMLRRIFGLKSNLIIRRWSKLHNEELHNFFFTKYNQNNKVIDD